MNGVQKYAAQEQWEERKKRSNAFDFGVEGPPHASLQPPC